MGQDLAMTAECHCAQPSPLADWWRSVTYIVEWADGRSVEVEQPPLELPPPEYRSAA